jgi:hypothetical protein
MPAIGIEIAGAELSLRLGGHGLAWISHTN